jgi:hypothetical protein
MKNDWIIQFEEVPNFLHEPCIGCDEVDEIKCYTMKGSGPYCEQCFGALCDPDQALLLEERIARYERAKEAETSQTTGS